MPNSTLPTELMQPFMAPFAKLAQSNLELLTKFSLSPEAVSAAMAQAQRMFMQQSPAAAPPVQLPPNAVADLMVGLMKNYMEFLMELGQGGAAFMQQAPSTLMKATQQATQQATQAAARMPTAATMPPGA